MTAAPRAKSPINWPLLATGAGVVTAMCLAAAKLIAWQQTGSVAVLGSLADSLLDLAASAIAFFGVRMASQPPDHNHRYGHEKAEAIASLVQLVLISASAVFVFAESIKRLINPEPLAEPRIALFVMGGAVIATIGLIAFQSLALRHQASVATESDRAHYIGDVLGNVGTLLAVVLASQFGILWADGIAGLIAAGFLAWSVVEIGRRVLPQLMDEELSADEREAIRASVLEDPEVHGLHALRTRMAGSRIYMNMHLELDPTITLRQSHKIAERVHAKLLEQWPDADIETHQDLYGATDAHDQPSVSANP